MGAVFFLGGDSLVGDGEGAGGAVSRGRSELVVGHVGEGSAGPGVSTWGDGKVLVGHVGDGVAGSGAFSAGEDGLLVGHMGAAVACDALAMTSPTATAMPFLKWVGANQTASWDRPWPRWGAKRRTHQVVNTAKIAS